MDGCLQTATLIAGYGLLTQDYGIYKLRHVLDLRKLALGTVIGIPIGVGILAYLNPVYLRFGVGIVADIRDLWPRAAGVRADENRHRRRYRNRHIERAAWRVHGLGGIISTISCQWRGCPKDRQRVVFQPVLFVAFVAFGSALNCSGRLTTRPFEKLCWRCCYSRDFRWSCRRSVFLPLIRGIMLPTSFD